MNWNPTPRQLRQFGLAALVCLPALGGSWHAPWPVIAGLAAIGGLLAVLAMLRPSWVRPVFLGMCLVTLPIGMVVSEVVLLLTYCTLFVPLGLAFRLMGRDPLQRRFEPGSPSYWQPRPRPRGAESYLRQS
jgi:hypothetical protein